MWKFERYYRPQQNNYLQEPSFWNSQILVKLYTAAAKLDSSNNKIILEWHNELLFTY